MEPMTPEERWTKFENAMQSLMENQARHDVQIAQNEAAIRDLLVVSRIFLDSQKEMTAQIKANSAGIGKLDEKFRQGMDELREAQRVTEEKLHALIETVDRIIRDSKRLDS
jgi:hypothetical protein